MPIKAIFESGERFPARPPPRDRTERSRKRKDSGGPADARRHGVTSAPATFPIVENNNDREGGFVELTTCRILAFFFRANRISTFMPFLYILCSGPAPWKRGRSCSCFGSRFLTVIGMRLRFFEDSFIEVSFSWLSRACSYGRWKIIMNKWGMINYYYICYIVISMESVKKGIPFFYLFYGYNLLKHFSE